MSDGLQQVINYMIPAVGTPRGYFWTGELVAGTAVTIDFRNVSGGGIDGQPFRPSGVFIDNTRGTANLVVTINEIAYQMICLVGELLNLQFPAPIDVTISFSGEGEATLAFVDFPVLPYRNLAASAATVAWGSITGTLSDQTDLQAALDAKMPAVIDTAGEMVYGAVGTGVPTALGIGSNNQVLTVTFGVPAWANPTVSWGAITGVMTAQADLDSALGAKLNNVLTTTGDIIYSSSGTTAARLGIGADTEVLTVAGGVPTWAPAGGGGGGTQLGIASALASGNEYPFIHGNGPISGSAMNSTTRSQLNLAVLDADLTITGISIACQTGTAAQTIDVGIYEFLGSGQPGTCLASGQMSVATAGRKTVTLGAPVALTAGLYYVLVHVSSISPTFAVITQGSSSVDIQLSAVVLSDSFTRYAGGSTTYNAVLIEDTNLPGGSYTIAMDLTGLTLSTTNIVGFNSVLPIVGLIKQ